MFAWRKDNRRTFLFSENGHIHVATEHPFFNVVCVGEWRWEAEREAVYILLRVKYMSILDDEERRIVSDGYKALLAKAVLDE